MLRAQTKHPFDPLSATEISVAVATVRAAGATPEVVSALLIVFFFFSRIIICDVYFERGELIDFGPFTSEIACAS